MRLQAKVFRGAEAATLAGQLRLLFPDVRLVKPRASRNSSIEAFAVCRGYAPPPGFMADDLAAQLDRHFEAQQQDAEGSSGAAERQERDFAQRVVIPFLACGSLEAWDSDMTYDLDEDVAGSGVAKAPLEPVQPPIAAHYQAAIVRAQALAGR
jgi:tRNA (cytidine32/guanosine34-2'-O)-methyltransferase